MDVEKRARECAEYIGKNCVRTVKGFAPHPTYLTEESIQAITALVREAVAEERKSCAETAEANRAQDVIVMPKQYAVCVNCSLQIAQAIRARKP